MEANRLTKVVDYLRQLLPAPDAAASDAQLLGRFVAERDEEAFAALVYRHGPMVWGVCRRVLRHQQDTEDAFQATFLLLARKAASITARRAVGGWLHSVACRTAWEAQQISARRRARERDLADLPHPTTPPAEAQDWRPLLDRELDRLPEKYRTPVVLCELEGRARKEVARQLGVPEGTLSSRLAAARRMLARRLTQRGVTASGTVLAVALTESAATAGAPLPLVVSTAATAVQFAAGQAAALATPAAALTKGVLKAMFLSKLKTAVASMMVAATLVVGGFAYRAAADTAPAARDGDKDATDLEALRKENELLKLNLKLTLERVKDLEAQLTALRKAPVAKGEFETGWDKPVDPDNDCKFIRDKDGLTIEVPGKDHDLAIERNLMNTPRLLRDVEGDFTAVVRVSGTFRPTTTSSTDQRKPFVGAGLVLMNGDQTYIRLERASMYSDDKRYWYANWELREDGEWKLAGDAETKPLDEDKPVYLRMQRKGDKISGAVSYDGKEWSELEPLEVKLPAKLKIGVSGGGTSTEPFKPHFDHFRLTTDKGKTGS